jgi:pimeloyl-ACP methyl ester carboxylesterase
MSFLLAHRIVEAAGADRAAYVLHGALGSGQNFGRFAARLAEARPDLEYVLVDLRNHGRSAGAPPPHTLESCARDVLRLADHLGKPVDTLIGHSFGG